MGLADLHPEDVEWSRSIFSLIAEGGVWGVPRSGLVFQKQDGGLILVDQMPYQEGMPGSAEELSQYQEGDYQDIKKCFEAAGISVSRKDNLDTNA